MAYGEQQIEFLQKQNYLEEGQDLEDKFEKIKDLVKAYEARYSEGLADRLDSYFRKQIGSMSTPQWANLGKQSSSGSTPLPASCYIVAPENSIQGIYYAIGETAMMSKLGGGVGADFTNIHDKGTKLESGLYTNSKLDWAEDLISAAQKVSQGSTRRGYAVPFFSFDDSEFYDILKRIDKKNPDQNDPFVGNNVCFIMPRGFRQRMKEGDAEAKKRFVKVLALRKSTGAVYILDIENCNKNQSPVYEVLGHEVSSSNICQEITTPKYSDKSFVCVISSLNLVHWDEIKANPQIIKDMMMFLDICVEEFIRLTEGIPFMEKARRSAIEKRDIGLGTLGFHEYLQSKDAAFGDLKSRQINHEIYSTINKYANEYAVEMGEKLGSPAMCQEAGMVRRNVSLMMVAPNKSTSFICGNTSLGIEPFLSNYFTKSLAGIQITYKSKYVTKILDDLGKNTHEVWDSILDNLGSVQHLDFLTDHQKLVARTASEISPKDIIDLAGDRQKFIDMSQSVNLFNRPNYTTQDIIKIHLYAFEREIKTLYYYYSQGHAAIEKNGASWDVCAACAD
jgi:ribonucleoside-diphosphate reductase alpha chain